MTNVPTSPPVPQGSSVPLGDGIAAPVTAVTTGTLVMDTYEIESLINSGGMGEVYRGRNIHNGEPVAIKIVLPSLSHDPKIVALFQRESSVLSRLSHDAIVRYHTFTIDRTIGRPCMVMEFVSGLPLADRIEQGPMPLDEVRVMIRRVASGLDKAHRAGVVHRDLSPDNIILEEGSVEHAKLIDFGIAKSMTGAGTLLGGQFAGKFNWVSPEQLGAFGGTVDGRSDIYSLALLVAAASKGAVLPMGASIVDAVGKRASVPDLDGVDPSLVPLLQYMLEPDPAARPATMAAVIAALDNPVLIPARPQTSATGGTEGLDPNRTIIGSPLPPPSLPPAGFSAQAPARTAIAAARAATEAPMEVDAQDISPFGASIGVEKTGVRPGPAPVGQTQSRSGGLIAVMAVLLVVGGGAAAWLTGAIGGGTAIVAANDANPVATGEPAPGPGPAPDTDPVLAPGVSTEPVTDGASADVPDPEATPVEAEPVAATDPAPETERSANADAGAEPPPQTAPPDTDPPDTAQPETAPPDAAATEPAVTDPKALQRAWLRDYKQPSCLHVRLESDAGSALALEGFADAVAPLEKMASAFQTATGVRPDVGVRLINDTQCAVLDFVNRHLAGSGRPLTMTLSDPSEVVKSGSTVSGRIEGLAGRSVALFLVNGAGGATNLKPWVSQSSDGTMQFDFTVNLAEGSPPAPQMLLAIATPDYLPKMDAVPNGVTVKSLMPFIDLEVTGAGQQVTTGLRFFRLEN